MKRLLPLLLGAVASAVLLWAFWELAEGLVGSASLTAFDLSISAAVRSLRTAWLTPVMMGITFLGDSVVVVSALALLVFVLVRRGRRFDAAYMVAVVAVGTAMSHTMKNLFERPRPELEHALIRLPSSFSFPSGHTMGSLCLTWVLGYAIVWSPLPFVRKAGLLAACAAYALSVAFSRVYLGVHWPSDVVASWLLGGAWIALATGVYAAIQAEGV